MPDTIKRYQDKYIEELKNHFGSDQRRINHSLKVLGYALEILEGENLEGEIRYIVVTAALLHDVGIKPAEEKYNSSAGSYQEIEGPPIVAEMMTRHGEPPGRMERVAYIVGGHHTPAKNNGIDFQIIWEADLLVNIAEEGLDTNPERLEILLAKNFRTTAGIRIAHEFYKLA